MEEFLQFWAGYAPAEGNKFHQEDRDVLQHLLGDGGFIDCNNLVDYVALGHNRHDIRLLHKNLYPQPFLGNLKSADIFFILLNPGFGDEAYFAIRQEAFQIRKMSNLGGNAGAGHPFMYLDPNFCWTSGYMWWEQRLRPYARQIAQVGNQYWNGLQSLSRRVAAIELFAYPSENIPWSPKKRDRALPQIPSSNHAIDAIGDVIVRAQAGDAIVFFKKNAAAFLSVSENNNENRYVCEANQGFQIGKKSPAGIELTKWIETKPR